MAWSEAGLMPPCPVSDLHHYAACPYCTNLLEICTPGAVITCTYCNKQLWCGPAITLTLAQPSNTAQRTADTSTSTPHTAGPTPEPPPPRPASRKARTASPRTTSRVTRSATAAQSTIMNDSATPALELDGAEQAQLDTALTNSIADVAADPFAAQMEEAIRRSENDTTSLELTIERTRTAAANHNYLQTCVITNPEPDGNCLFAAVLSMMGMPQDAAAITWLRHHTAHAIETKEDTETRSIILNWILDTDGEISRKLLATHTPDSIEQTITSLEYEQVATALAESVRQDKNSAPLQVVQIISQHVTRRHIDVYYVNTNAQEQDFKIADTSLTPATPTSPDEADSGNHLILLMPAEHYLLAQRIPTPSMGVAQYVTATYTGNLGEGATPLSTPWYTRWHAQQAATLRALSASLIHPGCKEMENDSSQMDRSVSHNIKQMRHVLECTHHTPTYPPPIDMSLTNIFQATMSTGTMQVVRAGTTNTEALNYHLAPLVLNPHTIVISADGACALLYVQQPEAGNSLSDGSEAERDPHDDNIEQMFLEDDTPTTHDHIRHPGAQQAEHQQQAPDNPDTILNQLRHDASHKHIRPARPDHSNAPLKEPAKRHVTDLMSWATEVIAALTAVDDRRRTPHQLTETNFATVSTLMHEKNWVRIRTEQRTNASGAEQERIVIEVKHAPEHPTPSDFTIHLPTTGKATTITSDNWPDVLRKALPGWHDPYPILTVYLSANTPPIHIPLASGDASSPTQPWLPTPTTIKYRIRPPALWPQEPTTYPHNPVQPLFVQHYIQAMDTLDLMFADAESASSGQYKQWGPNDWLPSLPLSIMAPRDPGKDLARLWDCTGGTGRIPARVRDLRGTISAVLTCLANPIRGEAMPTWAKAVAAHLDNKLGAIWRQDQARALQHFGWESHHSATHNPKATALATVMLAHAYRTTIFITVEDDTDRTLIFTTMTEPSPLPGLAKHGTRHTKAIEYPTRKQARQHSRYRALDVLIKLRPGTTIPHAALAGIALLLQPRDTDAAQHTPQPPQLQWFAALLLVIVMVAGALAAWLRPRTPPQPAPQRHQPPSQPQSTTRTPQLIVRTPDGQYITITPSSLRTADIQQALEDHSGPATRKWNIWQHGNLCTQSSTNTAEGTWTTSVRGTTPTHLGLRGGTKSGSDEMDLDNDAARPPGQGAAGSSAPGAPTPIPLTALLPNLADTFAWNPPPPKPNSAKTSECAPVPSIDEHMTKQHLKSRELLFKDDRRAHAEFVADFINNQAEDQNVYIPLTTTDPNNVYDRSTLVADLVGLAALIRLILLLPPEQRVGQKALLDTPEIQQAIAKGAGDLDVELEGLPLDTSDQDLADMIRNAIECPELDTKRCGVQGSTGVGESRAKSANVTLPVTEKSVALLFEKDTIQHGNRVVKFLIKRPSTHVIRIKGPADLDRPNVSTTPVTLLLACMGLHHEEAARVIQVIATSNGHPVLWTVKDIDPSKTAAKGRQIGKVRGSILAGYSTTAAAEASMTRAKQYPNIFDIATAASNIIDHPPATATAADIEALITYNAGPIRDMGPHTMHRLKSQVTKDNKHTPIETTSDETQAQSCVVISRIPAGVELLMKESLDLQGKPTNYKLQEAIASSLRKDGYPVKGVEVETATKNGRPSGFHTIQIQMEPNERGTKAAATLVTILSDTEGRNPSFLHSNDTRVSVHAHLLSAPPYSYIQRRVDVPLNLLRNGRGGATLTEPRSVMQERRNTTSPPTVVTSRLAAAAAGPRLGEAGPLMRSYASMVPGQYNSRAPGQHTALAPRPPTEQTSMQDLMRVLTSQGTAAKERGDRFESQQQEIIAAQLNFSQIVADQAATLQQVQEDQAMHTEQFRTFEDRLARLELDKIQFPTIPPRPTPPTSPAATGGAKRPATGSPEKHSPQSWGRGRGGGHFGGS